jgi:outer membrane protein assembly factor BamB
MLNQARQRRRLAMTGLATASSVAAIAIGLSSWSSPSSAGDETGHASAAPGSPASRTHQLAPTTPTVHSMPSMLSPSQPVPAAASTSPIATIPSSAAPTSSLLPADLLIADKRNNRLVIVDPSGRLVWQFPRLGDLAVGQTFLIPDDAFFSPDGKYIVATEEDDFAIRIIDVATHRIVGSYGHPGIHGAAPGYMWNPDDAMMLANGDVVSADIKNCRVVVVSPSQQTVVRQLGVTGHCAHNPPATFGSPNGAFPMSNGHYLVTEINGDWVDEIDLAGHVYWSAHPPGVRYPSDTNQIGPDRYLTVDYSSRGQVVIFNQAGQTIWRYAPTGSKRLNHPSLALPLPNGDVVVNDDLNDRVIVIDPTTGAVVWQYGHTGVPGSANGYLDIPDGVDLAPPYSLESTHPATSP